MVVLLGIFSDKQIAPIILMLCSGAFWILTYILIIKQGFREKTYGIPLAALCANMSWEFIFSFLHSHPSPQIYVNIVWFLLDIIILLQLLKFWQSEFKDLPKKLFYSTFLLAMVTSFCLILFITHEFNDQDGSYAAFGANFLMSILFITMLYRRNSLRGQSIYIAIFKMMGTAFASVAFYLFAPISKGSILLPFLYVAIFVFDLIYIILVYKLINNRHL